MKSLSDAEIPLAIKRYENVVICFKIKRNVNYHRELVIKVNQIALLKEKSKTASSYRSIPTDTLATAVAPVHKPKQEKDNCNPMEPI